VTIANNTTLKLALLNMFYRHINKMLSTFSYPFQPLMTESYPTSLLEEEKKYLDLPREDGLISAAILK